MKKCILILPYFGNFKNYFPLFLRSCGMNKKFNWLIITDNNHNYNYPENVQVIKMSFEDFRAKVQQKFDFEISLECPYKLCDYKPVYGYVCKEWIKEYEYWGHCDCDLLFGNLDKLLFPLLNEDYNKLFVAGHLTIYKNDEENNIRFTKNHNIYNQIYKKVFQSNEIFAFDEMYRDVNVHRLFQQDKVKMYTKDISYNVSSKYFDLRRTEYDDKKELWVVEKKQAQLLYWHNGEVLRITTNKGELVTDEFIYIHLQMRNLNYSSDCDIANAIKITPLSFENRNNIVKSLDEWKKEKKFWITKNSIIKNIKNCYHYFRDYNKKPFNPYEK